MHSHPFQKLGIFWNGLVQRAVKRKEPSGGGWELHVCCTMAIDADGKVMPRDH